MKIPPPFPSATLFVIEQSLMVGLPPAVKAIPPPSAVHTLSFTVQSMIVGLADCFGIPVRYVGVGEAIDDLRDFSAKDFADALFEE